jgi:hypothetical protein
MKQLENFLNKLRDAGYSVMTNWQKELNRGYLEHITIKGKVGTMLVLFQVYGKTEGYSMYIESKGITFDEDLKVIKGIVD